MRGPTQLAVDLTRMLPSLIAEREAAADKATRKQLSSRIKTSRFLLSWCKTREGFDPQEFSDALKGDPLAPRDEGGQRA